MGEIAYEKETGKDFESAVIAVMKAVESKGWSLFQIYDIRERFRAKGFDHSPLKIIEICKAPHAFKLLQKNKLVSLCMPCKINVIKDEKNEKVKIVGMKPSMVAELFDKISEEDVREVEEELKEIIDLAVE